ncbi:MAG TPA: hypothetical protein VES97_00920 [Solirubrobacteraceae bacterium]|nr:hypothetical protein [Solirubrobacteraceae bacterium]
MNDARPHTESELVDFVRSIDIEAPAALHRRVETLIAEQARLRRRPAYARPVATGWRLGGALALTAVAAAALVVGLSGGGAAAPTVREASALTRLAATTAAPAENPRNRAQLTAAVDGVAFPYWEERFGWRSTGARSDRLAGRTVTTVFYADSRGRQIGYAIVGGPTPRPSGGVVTWHDGTPYRLLLEHGMQVVAWQRSGHLCVVSGHGVSGATLLRLASWDDHGRVAA